ncbi:MAG: RNA polymerase sigma factor [candidate division Zixibacteria bacterium]|nr:RNA polymerase sigma factor [candidate division Zixibacteria bacterium]
MDHETIEKLAAKAKSGDRKAFGKIVRLMMNKIVALTYRMTGDRESAYDLAQDTFLAVWENLKSFRGEASFSSWLYRIASNKTLNYLNSPSVKKKVPSNRVEQVTDELISTDPNPEQILNNKLLYNDMLTFMGKLPSQQRLVFEFRFYEGLPFNEIARLMNKAEGTVKTHYRQAVIKLREYVVKKGWQS